VDKTWAIDHLARVGDGKIPIVGGDEIAKILGDWEALGTPCAADQQTALGVGLRWVTTKMAEKLQQQFNAKRAELRDARAEAAYVMEFVSRYRAGGADAKLRCFKPSELRAYVPSPGEIMVGKCHITRGEVFVIGGEAGVGKSTAATELAVCGATRRDWFGLPVHTKFRTLIVQSENGRYRLKTEYEARGLSDDIDDFIRVSEPPPFGMALTDVDFRRELVEILNSFRPDVVLFDPWNAITKDDKQKDYVDAFKDIRGILAATDNRPALGVVAHTRKPKAEEKLLGGTAMMHLLSGSYVLSSVPRSVFILTRASRDETDNQVVMHNPKNNNGELVARSAWYRQPSGFTKAEGFDWGEYDSAGDSGRKTHHTQHV